MLNDLKVGDEVLLRATICDVEEERSDEWCTYRFRLDAIPLGNNYELWLPDSIIADKVVGSLPTGSVLATEQIVVAESNIFDMKRILEEKISEGWRVVMLSDSIAVLER